MIDIDIEEFKLGAMQIKKAQALEEKGGELEGFIAQIRMPDGSLINVNKDGEHEFKKVSKRPRLHAGNNGRL